MELECGYSPPKQNNHNLIFLAPSHSGLAKVAVGKITPGKGTAVRRSCFLPHSTDIDYKLLHTHTHTHTHICTHFPPQIPRLCCFETASLTSGSVPAPEKWLRDRMAACWSWISPPVAKCVYGVFAFVLRCLSCSHTVLPKELSLGVIFFLLTFLMLCCIFSSPVYLLAFRYSLYPL